MKKGTTPKKHKGSSEQFFPNLVTEQQQQIKDFPAAESKIKSKRKGNAQQLEHSYLDEQEEMNISVEQLKKSSVQKMSILVGQLLAKNKINVKNAFEVPLIHINETCAFAQTSTDSSWKRLSSTLQSNNKIYGYRVDATHTYTYKVLESITRQEKKQNQIDPTSKRERETNSFNPQAQGGQIEDCYGRYLEKNYRNINILHVQTFFNVNPVLEKTKRIFDQNGLRGLLLNNLDMSLDLSLRLTLNHSIFENTVTEEHTAEEQQIQVGNFECCFVFQKIETICVENNLIEKIEGGLVMKRQGGEIQQLWEYFQGESYARGRKKTNVTNQAKETFLLPVGQTIVADIICQPNLIIQNTPKIVAEPYTESIQPQFLTSFNHQPLINDKVQSNSQIVPNNSSQNHKHQAENTVIVQHSTNEAKVIVNTHNALISAYIKINKSLSPIDIALSKNNQRQENTQECMVEKWKNPKPTVKRTRRKRSKPIDAKIQFMDQNDEVSLKRRTSIMSIDKIKKKQFKKILKEFQIVPYYENNCDINITEKILNFKLKTILSEYMQPQITDYVQGNFLQNQAKKQISQTINASLDSLKYGKNTSIRQAKERIQQYIQQSQREAISFDQIYKEFSKIEGYTPALCFLTVLHLTNEQGYDLIQKQGDSYFEISKK